MKTFFHTIVVLLLVLIITINKSPGDVVFRDNFRDQNQWRFITDAVMGGVSTGTVVFETKEGSFHALLSGNVTTENNGGFIQIRRNLRDHNLTKAKYIKIVAKGNNQKYFIHLRTTGMLFPWQYYQSEFIVTEEFKEFILPIKGFKKSGFLLANTVQSRGITSLGIVAIGRNHQAKIYIKEILFIE
ncbi:MAG: hypothetical protein CFH42_01315 [Alphaproteobacteria bacterium MarineAlpha12_Bin1]|nr:MAG: hypothetical protein CFH42_01315 [Alphaproteobacteria bacterium MarineAlpha12_Bin1]